MTSTQPPPPPLLAVGLGSRPHWRELLDAPVQRRVDLFYGLRANVMAKTDLEPEDLLMCLGAISQMAATGGTKVPERVAELLDWMSIQQRARLDRGDAHDPGERP